jgi:VIT1/CCC1 family predicted Fe2+/Mn2+ transporter
MNNLDVSPSFARSLVLDELFDLTLYRTLRPVAGQPLRKVLDELIPVETRHMEFWRAFFHLSPQSLGFGRKLKLGFLYAAGRVFGDGAIQLILEGIEVSGIRKYLTVWEAAKGKPLGEAVKDILKDEMGHEDELVLAGSSRRMDPEKVRSIFLGFNDGCVEILGAVTGFMAAFKDPAHVLAASVLVAFAGALSMAAGAWAAVESETEVFATEDAKRRFMSDGSAGGTPPGSPWSACWVVGISYFVGAAVPVAPAFLGAHGLGWIVASAGAAVVAVSVILSFLTGMAVRRRIAINLVVVFLAVGLSWAAGLMAGRFWGITL